MSAPEFHLQKDVCELLTMAYPDVWFASIPNGAALCATNDPVGRQRAKREISKLKITGMKVGAPDLLLCWKDVTSTGYPLPHTGFVELKAGKTGRLSDDQEAVHESLRALGHRVAVCRSTDDLIATLTEWGVPTRLAK